MIDFVTYLEEDAKGERWVTVMHRHVKIDGNGNIIGGLGGNFNGKPLSHAADHLASPEGAKKNKATPETSSKKIKQALSILKNNPDLSSKEIKDIFMKNLGMSPGGAAVYLTKVKKLHAASEKSEEPLKIKTKEKKKISLDSKEEPKKVTDKDIDHLFGKDKEEPKSDEKEKSGNKTKLATEIFKSMPGASSKEVQAKFKSQLGMSPGMAAVYYHKIKKQFGDTESKVEEPKPKNVDDTVKNEYEKHVKDNGVPDKVGLNTIYGKIKAEHPELGVSTLASKLSNYHHSKKVSSADVKSDENPKGIDKSQEDEISQHIEKLHKYKQGVDLVSEIKKKHNLTIETAYNLYKKYKKIHSEAEGEQHVKPLLQLKSDSEAIKTLAKEMNIHTDNAKEYWENHPEVKKFNEKAGKHVADQFDKYNMGLKTQSQALKNISDELGIHFMKAEEMWADHKRKTEADAEDKQKTADKIFADGKKEGLKYSEIASKIKKNLGYPTNVIKYIDNAEKNHDRAKLDAAYDDFKHHEYMGHDDVTKASTLQAKHGYSYDDSWEALEKLKSHHGKQSQYHLDQAISLLKKHSDKTYGDHVDIVGKELGLNPYHAELMTSDANKAIKKEHKDVAISAYKKVVSWGGGMDEVIDHIKNTLGVDQLKATKLFNLAKNTVADEKASGLSYSDVKAKTTEHNSGAQVFYNHDENTHEIEPEHVKVYHRKVELAKKVYGHDAFDPHEHLIRPYSYNYDKLDKKTKDMSQAIYDYTGSHYHDINAGLRQGSVYSGYKKTVKDMDKAYAHKSAKTTKDTVVYRGYTNNFANKLEPGDILEDKGFMSTSADKHKAESWAGSDAAVVHILLPKGSSALTVASISQHGSESEILLNRGAKLRIIKKEPRKNSWGEMSGVTLYAEYDIENSHGHMKEEKPKRKYTKKKVDSQE